jgi:hypothetical protein
VVVAPRLSWNLRVNGVISDDLLDRLTTADRLHGDLLLTQAAVLQEVA